MGDFNTPECSWKKMVIAKSNNAWVSTIKTDQITKSNTMDTTSFSLGDDEIPLCDIKRENTEEHLDVADQTNSDVEVPIIDTQPETIFMQESPLLLEKKTRRKRKQGKRNTTEHLNAVEPHSNSVPEILIQELNPLLIQTPIKRRRCKGSGPKYETPEERAMRLAKMSAYAAQRIANETPDQRAIRLRRMSEYAAKRLSNETSEQRAKRLARMSEYSAKRLAKETPEQRRARLTRMSEYAAKRHAQKKMTHDDNTIESFNLPHSVNSLMNNVLPDQI